MSQSPGNHSDPFAPPKTPCEVQCIHCGESYESWRIEWRDATDGASGYWSCPTPGCDGIGFGFDIFPVDSKWTDENGEPLVAFFTDEEQAVDDETADEPDFTDEEMAAMELEDDVDDDDSDDDSAGLPIDTFDADSFWIDVASLMPPPMGASPQPPFDAMPSQKKPWSTYGPDDIPF